jgi:hypothetical protein
MKFMVPPALSVAVAGSTVTLATAPPVTVTLAEAVRVIAPSVAEAVTPFVKVPGVAPAVKRPAPFTFAPGTEVLKLTVLVSGLPQPSTAPEVNCRVALMASVAEAGLRVTEESRPGSTVTEARPVTEPAEATIALG